METPLQLPSQNTSEYSISEQPIHSNEIILNTQNIPLQAIQNNSQESNSLT